MTKTTTKTTTFPSVQPPVLRYKVGSAVVPGDRLGTIRQVGSGEGTYVRGGHIYASLVGTLALIENNILGEGNGSVHQPVPSSSPTQPLFSCSVRVVGPTQNGTAKGDRLHPLPATAQVLRIGQLVVGKVLRVTPQNAVVEIRAADHVGPLRTPTEGAIRMEDVRSGATEQLPMGDCFRPGDLVVCRIVSLGDARRYFLSTAETELGVVRATTANGVQMVPISWKEMVCPETGTKELRKCAKPVQLPKQDPSLKVTYGDDAAAEPLLMAPQRLA